MGKPLKNAPVYLTVAQVRFNPILTLGDFIPEIQESFRRAGYPAFRQYTVHAIQVVLGNGEAPIPVPQQKPKYLFGDIGSTHQFLIDTDSLTFQSTDYGSFEKFSEAFLEGLELLHKAVKLDYTERVGARYLDRVQPRNGESLDKYLHTSALGLGGLLSGSPLHSFSQSLMEGVGARLVSRVVVGSGPVAFPPDLLPMELRVLDRFHNLQGLHAVLDNDGFFEGREPYSVEGVRKHLDDIHVVISEAFRVLTTPYALKMWKQET